MSKDMETAADVVLATELDAAVEKRIVEAIDLVFSDKDYAWLMDRIIKRIGATAEFERAVMNALSFRETADQKSQRDFEFAKQLERAYKEKMEAMRLPSKLTLAPKHFKRNP
jgi:hypothetical protein